MLDLNANLTANGTDAVMLACMLGIMILALVGKSMAVRIVAIIILFAGFGGVLMAPLLLAKYEPAQQPLDHVAQAQGPKGGAKIGK